MMASSGHFWETSWNIANAISVSAWIRFATDPLLLADGRYYVVFNEGWRIWYSGEGESNNGDQKVEHDQFFWDLYYWNGVGSEQIEWQQDTWYHLAATFDGSEAKIYVNGELNNSELYPTATIRNSFDDLYIGSKEAGGEFFNGDVDELRIYNRALSGDEIQDLYNTMCIDE